MSYIGQGLPADVFSGYVTDTFTGDGSTTTFTLSKEPFSADSLIVVIDNVIQQPTTNFTVSGTTLTIVGTAILSGIKGYAIHTGGVLPITTASAVAEGTTIDLNGGSDKLILDADGDTTISADTDDQIDFKIGGSDKISISSAGTLSLTSGNLEMDDTQEIRLGTGNDLVINFSGTDSIIDHTPGSGGLYIRGDNVTIQDSQSTPNQFVRMDQGSGITVNDGQIDHDFRIESNDFPRMFQVDAAQNEVQVTDASSFYDTDSRFSVRTTGNNRAVHFSTSDGSYSNRIQQITLEPDESASAYFLIMQDYNDDQITFRGDGNGFFDGAADAGNADFAEYFESTDGSAIAIGKTVVLDNGKVRASTDSDNAADIVGVVRHRKTVGVVGNSAWNKWKGKFKVDDYGVPLLEEYTITEWDQVVTEDADDLENTDRGKKKKLPQVKGDTVHHSYATDKIPSELTAPSDAVVKTKDDNGNTFKRKILSDSYDASKEYVSREDRDEWNLIGLTGQVTMTKGQKTGDRWIKMRDISDTVEEWLIR